VDVDRGQFVYPSLTKEPAIEEHVRKVESENVKRTLAGVERVWRAIEAGVFYPAPSTMLPDLHRDMPHLRRPPGIRFAAGG